MWRKDWMKKKKDLEIQTSWHKLEEKKKKEKKKGQ